MATGTRRRPRRRFRPLYSLELCGRTARSPSTRDEVRMPSQLHARPKRSTRPSEARRALGSFAFPSVRASARQDGRRRLHECGIKDSEALVQAGAPLVEIGDPFNLEVVADILSTDAPQIEKGAAVPIDGRAEQPSWTRRDFLRYRRSGSRRNGSVS